MRIVAGTMRGRRLASLGKGDAAAHLRPTSDRVRESLFSILDGGRFGDVIDGVRVLDLFSGTGALGFEALSRGATHVTAVDSGRKAQTIWRENAAMLDLGTRAQLLRCEVMRLPAAAAPCGLVFLDPPYGQDQGAAALDRALAQGWLTAEALVVWEEASAQSAPKGFHIEDSRRYGDTWVTFLRVLMRE
ncbi:MAG: 16S rRNA (guanine(966)-N(2))-methyltransferase RsmD [Pseudoprimorskyibacter sp.]|nr:16S rRNA (guanine(966)-N(2))-methyltransferase RsmD [Pseudoprimorskyibacter sp.]